MRAICIGTSLVVYVACVSGLVVALLKSGKHLVKGEGKARPVGSSVLLATSIWTIGFVGICGVLFLPALRSGHFTDEFSVFLGFLSIWSMLGMLAAPIVVPIVASIARVFGSRDKSIRPAWLVISILVYLVAWFIISRNTWFLVGS